MVAAGLTTRLTFLAISSSSHVGDEGGDGQARVVTVVEGVVVVVVQEVDDEEEEGMKEDARFGM